MYVLVAPDDHIVRRSPLIDASSATWLNANGVKEGYRWLPLENLPDAGTPTLSDPYLDYSDYVLTVEADRVTRQRTVTDKDAGEITAVKQGMSLSAADMTIARIILLMLNYMRVESGLTKAQFSAAVQAASTSQGAQLIDIQNLRTFIENNL